MLYYFFNAVLPSLFYSLADDRVEGGTLMPGFTVGHAGVVALAVVLAYFIFCYLFLGFGLFTMAKRRNMKIAYLAFIPVASTYLLGKLVGEVNFFGLRIKRIWAFALGFEILALALRIADDWFYLPVLADCWQDEFNMAAYENLFGTPQYNMEGAVVGMLGGKLNELGLASMIVQNISNVVSGINEFVNLIVLLFLFRNYAPRSGFLFALLALLFNFMGPILVFAIRNNSCEEYREYMKMKMHSMYGGGNPYQYGDGTYRDPYDLSKGGDKKEEKPESPFDEYN